MSDPTHGLGHEWADIGTQTERVAYLRQKWPALVARIEREAARPDISNVPHGTRPVLVSDGLLEALADRVEWGEPEEDGWYKPALWRNASWAALDMTEYAVWYGRKKRGAARVVAQALLDEHPALRAALEGAPHE